MLSVTESWFSFRARGGVTPHVKAAPKSFHDWKSKFFFINRGVIPVPMSVRDLGMEVVDEELVAYKSEAWYRTLIQYPVDIRPIDEISLVKVGMSRMLVDPLKEPVLMVVNRDRIEETEDMTRVLLNPRGYHWEFRDLPEGRTSVLHRTANLFLYPLADEQAFAAGADVNPGEGDASHAELVMVEDEDAEGVNVEEDAGDLQEVADVEPLLRRARGSTSAPEANVEDVPLILPIQAVSATEGRVIVGEKRKGGGDAGGIGSSSLSSPAHKRGRLADSVSSAEKMLLGQLLSPRQGSAEVGVKKPTIILKKSTAPVTTEGGVAEESVTERGKTIEEGTNVEEVVVGKEKVVGEGVKVGAVGALEKGKDVGTETHQEVVTPATTGAFASSLGGKVGFKLNPGAPSRSGKGSGGKWFQPRWSLTPSSRLSNVQQCQQFLGHCLPPAELEFQRTRSRADLLDENAYCLANLLSTNIEIVREWDALRDDRDLFEKDREDFEAVRGEQAQKLKDMERELELARKGKSEAEARVKEIGANWKETCECHNAQIKKASDLEVELRGRLEVAGQLSVKLRGLLEEKDVQLSSLQDLLVARDTEVIELREKIVDLEKNMATVTEEGQQAHTEMLDAVSAKEDLISDRDWLLGVCIPEVVHYIKDGPEMRSVIGELLASCKLLGRKEGFNEGYQMASDGKPASEFPLTEADVEALYNAKTRAFDSLEFPLINFIKGQVGVADLKTLKSSFEKMSLHGASSRARMHRTAKDSAAGPADVGPSGVAGDDDEEQLLDYSGDDTPTKTA